MYIKYYFISFTIVTSIDLPKGREDRILHIWKWCRFCGGRPVLVDRRRIGTSTRRWRTSSTSGCVSKDKKDDASIFFWKDIGNILRININKIWRKLVYIFTFWKEVLFSQLPVSCVSISCLTVGVAVCCLLFDSKDFSTEGAAVSSVFVPVLNVSEEQGGLLITRNRPYK